MKTINPNELQSLGLERIAVEKVAKGLTFSVLIPARGHEAAETLPDIISSIRSMWMDQYPVVDEIGVVIDPDSNGQTYGMRKTALRAGATWAVYGKDVPLSGGGATAEGKGGAMRRLATLALGSRLIFHDADLKQYDPMTIGVLTAASVFANAPKFVNGSSPRLTGNGSPGGRTTEMVRSLFSKQLHTHVPGITQLVQPLIGEFVVDAEVFAQLPFSSGYGIETSLKVLAMDMLKGDDFVQVELPAKFQSGQHYLDLVKQFHEISFIVDVLERYFLTRWDSNHASPADIANNYSLYFPDRTLELLRPEGYDNEPFTPRRTFFEPLVNEPLYQEHLTELEGLRWKALQATAAQLERSLQISA